MVLIKVINASFFLVALFLLCVSAAAQLHSTDEIKETQSGQVFYIISLHDEYVSKISLSWIFLSSFELEKKLVYSVS